ncbi:MAG: DNA-binding protein WhiA [Chloroflexi bacterium]|nr:MAG: DNA-binding protein WhiA [Chloroflexota bacterium]TMB96282.1 MAG: DNA-binding protein WhiA [Chloroflexota bacterium]TMC29176.1 MAG: DNA-binding protein WhiA [Chloroflexota bacterium]TMC34727.1 MAG: DNA-binding protein WhiA [Chloroflexota bacterium]TMC58672.1 MAG: DNA-binding protein WhiA [Chloroflexota bacterium]
MRSPFSEEIKAELSRIHPSACDARVLAALLPRAIHLGMPARRLAHSTETSAPSSLRKACCRRAYLRGLFLAGGSLSAGHSGYLLELRPPRGEATRARRLLIAAGLAPRARSRRGRAVLMLRSAEAIAAFLRLTGATETLLRFEARRVQREVRGRTNAAVNAESANLARTVAAAREQTAAIRALARTGRLARLPSELRGAAAARTHAPEATLSQLAARVSTTKWSMRQRLRRLVEEADR